MGKTRTITLVVLSAMAGAAAVMWWQSGQITSSVDNNRPASGTDDIREKLVTADESTSQNRAVPRPGPTPSPISRRVMTSEEIYRRFAGAVVYVTCEGLPNGGKSGSGVLVSADGFVATNAHVVEGCPKVNALYLDGKVQQSFVAGLKFYDADTDTAIIKIGIAGAKHFESLRDTVRLGERVYAIGNPRGFTQSFSEGIATGIRPIGDVDWLQHSAAISPGSSGGAIISGEGDLLGIQSSFVRDSQNLNFAVPAETITIGVASARKQMVDLKFPSRADAADSNIETREPAPDRVSKNESSPPQLLSSVEPDYSEPARIAKVHGTVMLSVEIDQSGQVRTVRVIRGLGFGLDEKAIEAVRRWRFRPGIKDGKPVTMAVSIEVNFRLL